ncbi:MAG: hypothetical protein QOK40_2936 [Miltoncostaeaceae bacterium]|nr:hypothetical protein [Miltoncostaeaceae bacterium]
MGPSLMRRRQRHARAAAGGRLRRWFGARLGAGTTRDRLAALVLALAGVLGAAFGAAALVGGVGSAAAAGAGWGWFKSDLHVHSVVSADGDPDLGIISQGAKNRGYNVLFVTDHGRGSEFPISAQTANHLVLDELFNRWTPRNIPSDPASLPALVPTPPAPLAQPALSPNVVRVASVAGGLAYVTSRRGPNLRSGNAVLKFSISPKTVSSSGGMYVSASIGGDPTVGPPAGYTTAAGVVSPGKSYVFVWYYKNPPPASLYGATPVFTFALGAAGSGSTCTSPTFSSSAWNTCTITLNTALASIPAADRPLDINGFLDLQVGASGSAEGYFDKYTLDATAPVPAAVEFAYRNSLVSLYDTPTFKMYPSVEIGVGNHTQRFNYATTDASQTLQSGTDAIAATQATGYPAQLNHPGVAGGVSPDQVVVDNDAFGADLMEVMDLNNMIRDWDEILTKGVQLIGSWGTDNHVGTWSGASEANYIQAPSIGLDDVMRSVYEGRLYMGLQDFTGRLVLNTDAFSLDAFPARYPIFISPLQAAAPVHLAVTGGLAPGSKIVWVTNGGAEFAVDSPQGSSFETANRSVSLAGAMTYVRAEVRGPTPAESKIAMTEPIMWVDVPDLPAGMSVRVDGVSTPGGTGYTRTTTKGITGVTWTGPARALTLALENPAGSLLEIVGTTGGGTPARLTVGGASVPRAGTVADYDASARAWLADASGALRIKITQGAGPTAAVATFTGGADTVPPNPPTGLASAPGAGGFTLGWNPASDNTGVTGYTVYRDGVALGEVTTNRYTDATAAPTGSYRYTVDAFDAARNQSLQSPAAVVGPLPPQQTTTTPTGPPPTTTVPGTPTPAAAILGAFRSIAGQAHSETFDVRAALRLGKVPSALARRAPRPSTVRHRGKAAVAQGRRALTSARLPGLSGQVTVLTYDGPTYVSKNGRTFRRAAGSLLGLLPWLPPAGLGQAPTAVPGSLGGLRSLGTARVDGVLSRRYQARLTPAGLRRYLAAALTRTGKAAAQARSAAATAKARVNRVDISVAVVGGQLVSMNVTVNAAIDAGRLVRGLRGRIPGTVAASTSVRASAYGTGVFVAKPRSSGVVATLRALARS